MTTTAPVIKWNHLAAQDCSVWAGHDDVRDFRTAHTPRDESDLDPNESMLQEFFVYACNALARSGSPDAPTTVRAFTHQLTLDRIHARTAWDGSSPSVVYRNAINKFDKTILPVDVKSAIASSSATGSTSNTNTNTNTSTTGTSRSQGPLKPDLMIVVKSRAGGASHPVWTCELKFVSHKDLTKPAVWTQRHRQGLSQAVWYLFSANSLCGASMGLLLVNGRFQRLLATTEAAAPAGTVYGGGCDGGGDGGGCDGNGNGDETKVLIVEVVSGSQKPGPQEGFGDYVYGEQSIPNLVPSDSTLPPPSTAPGTPTYRLWENLVTALKIAETRAQSQTPCAGAGCGVASDGAAGSGGAGSGGGDGGDGGRWKGKKRARNSARGDGDSDGEGDGSKEKRSEMRRPAPSANLWSAAPPLTPSSEQGRLLKQLADRDYVADWLRRQDNAGDTPESSVGSDYGKIEAVVQAVELDERRDDDNQDKQDVGGRDDDDDASASISQRGDESQMDDPPFLEMDDLTRWMRHYGWKFKFVTPEEMDIEVRTMAEQAARTSAAATPNVGVAVTPR